MTLKLGHIEPRKELSCAVRSFFEMSYDAEKSREDYLLPSGRIAFFYIKTERAFQVEFESSNNCSTVSTGYYLAYLDGAARYVHPKITVLAASIYPVYLGLIFRVKPKDILNTFTRLDTIFNIEDSGLPVDVSKLSSLQLMNQMQRFILAQLQKKPMREDIESVYKRIVDAKAYALTVKELSEWMGYTERHFTSIFQEYTGFSPKRFIQLVRFDRSLKMIDDLGSSGKLSDVAYEMGYHDQAHFTRDFKQFCGKTPKEIRAERGSAAYLFRRGRVY